MEADFSLVRHIFAGQMLDMERYEERICRYSLNRTFGYSPGIAHALVRHFGSAAALFTAGMDSLRDALPFTKGIDRINDKEYDDAGKELSRLESEGYRFISSDNPLFPALLKECEDSPVGLYVRSDSPFEEIFSGRPAIAVIGTRDLSPYGKDWCRRIISDMAGTGCGPVIVSGLALGTDIEAHRAALSHGLPTIAVIPTGIDDIYPYRHASDAFRIASSPGSAIVTDFLPGTKAVKFNFLRRNRIIAGLCGATVLVESRIKGGGMMTARLAFSYSRDVYALPGRIDDLRSQGCNLLIREKIAEPIVSGQALMESLGLGRPEGHEGKTDNRDRLDSLYSGSIDSTDIDIMARMLLLIKQHSGISIDEIASQCGMEYRKAAELAGLLESDGLISTDIMRRCTIIV